MQPQVRSAFPNYSPDLKDPAELGALKAALLMNLYFLTWDSNLGIYFDEPAIFKLQVSSDGQIIDYQAVNRVAIQTFRKHLPYTNLKLPQFLESQKAPYADFKLEAKGFFTRLTPWSTSQ